MNLTYGDVLSIGVKLKKASENKSIALKEGDKLWLVINSKDGEQKLYKESNIPFFEYPYEEISDIIPGEYDCAIGISWEDYQGNKFKTLKNFTLTVEEGRRVPIDKPRKVW